MTTRLENSTPPDTDTPRSAPADLSEKSITPLRRRARDVAPSPPRRRASPRCVVARDVAPSPRPNKVHRWLLAAAEMWSTIASPVTQAVTYPEAIDDGYYLYGCNGAAIHAAWLGFRCMMRTKQYNCLAKKNSSDTCFINIKIKISQQWSTSGHAYKFSIISNLYKMRDW